MYDLEMVTSNLFRSIFIYQYTQDPIEICINRWAGNRAVFKKASRGGGRLLGQSRLKCSRPTYKM